MAFPRVASLRTAEEFHAHCDRLGIRFPNGDSPEIRSDTILGQPLRSRTGPIGNRFCILPMEGWDGTPDGLPTDLVRRRWTNFGLSGAKLIWGCEAVAVRHDGRANPNQLLLTDRSLSGIEQLRTLLTDTHHRHFGTIDDLSVGLQLTHSGRYARPTRKDRPEPAIAYRHPVLDRRLNIQDDGPLLSDDDLRQLTADFVTAAVRAQRIGFSWVDIKHCHGYLGHEILSGFDRPGAYGGSFENRTRFLREIVEGIRSEAPGLGIGVRVSIFDFVPFRPGDEDAVGVPEFPPVTKNALGDSDARYTCAFGGDGSGLARDLTEPDRFLTLLSELGIDLVCTTAGSPYYNPHIQRPALFPPSDGYQPPEDPLIGVHRQIQATAELKRRHPEMIVVGSGYSYLQEWLAPVAQAVAESGMADSIGLGRMVLSYPDLPADILAGRTTARKKICRTFSDCTTAPRNGMVSGCYPLDPFYKERPERARLAELKQESASS